MKLKWKIQPKAAGRYASFEHRGWPDAHYENGKYAGGIYCQDDYSAWVVKENKHGPLTVRVFDWSGKLPKSLQLKKTFSTLQEAKDGLADIVTRNPQFQPSQERK